MTSTEPTAVQQQQPDRTETQINQAAQRLRELLGAKSNAEEIVRTVREHERIEQNKEVLLRFQREVFNARDWSNETLGRNLTEDFIDHAAMPGDPPGFEGVRMRFSYWAAAFGAPDSTDQFEENLFIIGEQDLLAVMYNLHAKHVGEFMGIEPTDREVTIPGMEIVRIRDNKIAEHWGIYDFLRTAEEVGANLAFVPRESPSEPVRPVVPWAVKMTEQDATGLGDAAEEYVNPRDDR